MERKKVVCAGFGVQGTTAAAGLLAQECLTHDDLVIIDINEDPLQVMGERLKDCDARFLRSGAFDHVHPERNSLVQFAERHGRTAALMTDKQRPCSTLFIDHARWTADQFRLHECFRRGLVTGFAPGSSSRLLVTTSVGQFEADKLVLALGMVAPNYPEFASRLRGHDPRISHIFDRDYEQQQLPAGERVAVIGGGITGAQVAASLAESGRQVLMMTRRALTKGEGTTSSDDWRDPERRRHLCSLEWPARLDLLRREGDRGTVPEWELARVSAAQAGGALEHRIGKIAHLIPGRTGIEVVDMSGAVDEVDLVVLATGLRTTFHDWIVESARQMDLPFYQDGSPVLSDTLEWGRDTGIHLLGHHACPVVGAFGSNISGGIIARDILCDCFAR